MKRAALIITNAPAVVLTETWLDYTQRETDLEPSEQLLADLRTLAGLPDDLALVFEDPRLRYADVQVDVSDWEEAQNAAARVRALLPKEGEDGD